MKRRQAVTLMALALLAASCTWYLNGAQLGSDTRLTAEFQSARALHAGDDVRIRGVRVGEIISVRTTAELVEVDMQVDPQHRIASSAGAVIIAPTLVSGRYVQLTGTDAPGPHLDDGSRIPLTRTASPVEWDEVREQLTDLSAALGPNSAGEAPLADALAGLADAAEGNGARLKETLDAASRAVTAVDGSSEDLFGTVRHLAAFLAALNANDAEVRAFTEALADVAGTLDTSRKQLRALLRVVNRAFRKVTEFVAEHGEELSATVREARVLTGQLNDLRLELANALHLAPTTLANFYNIYNPSSGAFTGRAVLPHGGALSNVLCQSIYAAGASLDECRKLAGPLLDQFDLKQLPGSVSGPQQPGSPNVEDSP